jgi:hypothetical protein
MKGARWMPRLATAMKDATNQRNASGRRFVVFDPEVSEWGNPASNGHLQLNDCKSSPREVKHLSTWRNRKQQRVAFRLFDASNGWKATLVIPLVAASETGIAQTKYFGIRGCKTGAPYLYGVSYKRYL